LLLVSEGLVTLYRVVVTAAPREREAEVAVLVNSLRGKGGSATPPGTTISYPIVVLRQASSTEAKDAGRRLKQAGAEVTLEAYESPAVEGAGRKRECPRCGSTKVRRFDHAAPAGTNVRNTKCLECGFLFHTNERI
jgi:predicted RNA-binding Zn-ribbon protein involved in translation (DUF1610 family)